jgi:DNA-binding NarL/FixJ family response regulator
MTRTLRTALDLNYHASGPPDHDTYLNTAAAWLSDGVPGDLTGWISVTEGTAEVWFNNDKVYRPCGPLAAVINEHPIVLHRRAHPDAALVLRLSDCIADRAFRASRVYRELFVPMGARYQLVIITAVNDSVTAGRCWIINRSTRDFAEADLLTVRSLQPALTLLDVIYSSPRTRRNNCALTEESGTPAHHLTVRELDVLGLVGDGLTARQIARLKRISVHTVRKHLEHIYQKLECHDRLLAVNKARQMGLLRGHESTRRAAKPRCAACGSSGG